MLAVAPIFSALVSRVRRDRLLPWLYRFLAINLLVFFALWRLGVAKPQVARAFFVWASVYNLFVTSVFWSLMADLFDSEQGKRLFGFIAAGGTTGGIAGPLFASFAVRPLSVDGLLLASAVLLGLY